MGADTYSRIADFSDDEDNNAGGRSTVLTADLDAELDAVRTALNSHAADLDVVLRDDNTLTADILQGHEFSAAAISVLGAALSAEAMVVRGEWATATAYTPKDVVTVTGDGSYVCLVAHTSPGAFVDDANWQKIASDGAPGPVSFACADLAINTTLDASHAYKTLVITASATITLPSAATMATGYCVTLKPHSFAVTVSIDVTGADTILGVAAPPLAFFGVGGLESITLQVNTAKTGYIITNLVVGPNLAGGVLYGNSEGFPTPLALGAAWSQLTAGSVAPAYHGNAVPAAKTGAYNVAASDHKDVIQCDATSGGFTVGLPLASSVGAGFEVTVVKTDTGSNVVTVDGNGAETINGRADLFLTHGNAFVTLLCTGTAWLVVNDGRGPIVARAYMTANQSHTASGVYENIDLLTVVEDPYGVINATTGLMTLPAGFTRWRLHGQVAFAPDAAGVRAITLYTGAGVATRDATIAASANSGPYISVHSEEYRRSELATAYMKAFQNTGGALNMLAAYTKLWVQVW